MMHRSSHVDGTHKPRSTFAAHKESHLCICEDRRQPRRHARVCHGPVYALHDCESTWLQVHYLLHVWITLLSVMKCSMGLTSHDVICIPALSSMSVDWQTHSICGVTKYCWACLEYLSAFHV